MLQSSSNRHISTSTLQRRLHESGLHGWIAAKKSLLKDTNNKKRLVWAKKHEQQTLDWWKAVFWSDESKCEIFGSNRCVFVRRRVWSPHVWFPPWSMEEGVWWCGVLCWWHKDSFRIQGTLNQHVYHSILQWNAIPSGLRLVGLSFVFQQDNDPTYLQAV